MTSIDRSLCPKCNSENIYQDRGLFMCPDCSHEWNASLVEPTQDDGASVFKVRDAHGNILHDGDAVTVVKDLKIKGSSSVVKIGTKARGIKLVESDDGHNIACRIDGMGAIHLKSEFVKKS